MFVEAEAAGELMFYGRGAGGEPTASAVLGDVVSVARHRVLGGKGPIESRYAELPVLPAAAARTRYQVRLDVADRPGVLAQVAAVLADARRLDRDRAADAGPRGARRRLRAPA